MSSHNLTSFACAELRARGLGEAASGEVVMLEGVTWLDDVPEGAEEVGSL